jgi:autotransporter-associated beta strand protein
LTISGANSFTGGTTVTGGSLVVERGASLGGSLAISGGSVVTIAVSDANGNPLNSVADSNTSAAIDATTGSPQPAAPTAASVSSLAAASTLTSTTASSEPPVSITVRPNSHDSSGSALVDKSNISESAGLIALQSRGETGDVTDLAYFVSNGSERPSSLTTAGVSPTSDAATFLERQTAQVPDTNVKLLKRDALAMVFADPEVLEWATLTPAPVPSAADADMSLLSDDLLAAIGQQWRN